MYHGSVAQYFLSHYRSILVVIATVFQYFMIKWSQMNYSELTGFLFVTLYSMNAVCNMQRENLWVQTMTIYMCMHFVCTCTISP